MIKSTISSISKATGFSRSTVSRVLNGKASSCRISKETVAKIQDEAQRCNYTPSLIARSLRTNKTNTIGLIVPNIDNPFFANISSVIVKEARAKGYTIIIADTSENESNEVEYVKSLTSRKIDGIIVVPCGNSPDILERIDKAGVPVILIDRYYNETSLSYVSTDNYKGAVLATEYLINNGHKNIVCIQGTPSAMPVKKRFEGYKDTMAKHGLSDKVNVVGNSFSIQNGYVETKMLINKKNRPTAIFAMSNTIALGAYKAIKESGLTVPKDISIIGFDNYLYLDYIEPPMTRIAQPTDEIGILAVKTLINQIEEKHEDVSQLLLSPTLLLGQSVSGV